MSAGRGERLKPLTSSVPKPLIEIAGFTLIEYLIHVIKGELDTIVIGTGWKHDLLEQRLNHLEGVITQYVPEWHKGPLHTLVGMLDRYECDEFLLCPSDYVIGPELLKRVLEAHEKNRAVITMAVDSSANRGTPIYLDHENRVIAIGDIQVDYHKSASSALMIIAGKAFAGMCKKAASEGQSRVREVIQTAISDGVYVSAVDVRGNSWYDADDLDSLLAANKHLLEHMTPLQESIVVNGGDVFETGDSVQFSSKGVIGSGVRVIGPTFIAGNCRVGDGCKIGPYVSLGSNTVVSPNSVLANCITQGTVVPRGHYEHCVIYGKHIITKED